jgi:cardiolipin synthase A/B
MPKGKRLRQKLRQAVFPVRRPLLLPGNKVTLLQNGEAYFPAIESAFDRATHEIYLETYIYQNDATGLRVADALRRAASRGVNVYLLIDGYGSKDLPQSMLEYLRDGGVKTLVFRPQISPWTLKRVRLRRLHRKIVVVDREIAFVGGINIVDDCEMSGDLPPRFDYAVAVEGPLVEVIRLSARRLWSMVAWSRFHKGTTHGGTPPVSTGAGGKMSAAFLVRDNLRHRRDIEKAYLQAIEQSKSEIILAHAYFLPGLDFRHALIDAAGRGVRVVLLLQGRVEYFLQHHATRALYGNLLDAGIEIYEYSKSLLHAKVAVIDGRWATVGSSNIDPFSLLLSREANVVVVDAEFVATLTQILKKTVEADGRRVLRDNWNQQPVYSRFVSWLSYGLLRFMMGISGYESENSQAKIERISAPEG